MHPILFKLGDGTVYSYGVLRVLASATGFVLLVLASRKLNESLSYAVRLVVAMLVGGYVAGRAGFILVNWRQPWTLADLVSPSGGYIAVFGLLGGLLAVTLFALVSKRHVGAAFDLVTAPVVGAWAVSNIGCFLAGCCTGSPSSVPWAMRFPEGLVPEARDTPVHPAQLYSLIVEAAVIALLFAWPRRFRGELCLRALAVLLAMRAGYGALGIHDTLLYAIVGQALLAGLALAVLVVLSARTPKVGQLA